MRRVSLETSGRAQKAGPDGNVRKFSEALMWLLKLGAPSPSREEVVPSDRLRLP